MNKKHNDLLAESDKEVVRLAEKVLSQLQELTALIILIIKDIGE